MKHYTLLILRQLRGQVRRSLLTMLSITLSVSLLSAVGTLAASIYQTQLNQAKALTGDFHGTLRDLTPEQLSRLLSDPAVEAVGYSAPLGGYNDGGLTLTLEGLDTQAVEMFGLHLVAGRFPAAQGEIVLEAWMLEQMDPRPDLGETIQLEYFPGGRSAQSVRSQAGFTLVGILETITAARVTNVSLGLLHPQSVQTLLPPDEMRFNAFVKLAPSAGDPRDALPRLANRLGLSADTLSFNETVLRAQAGGKEMHTPILILAGLVLAAAIAAIYNIFQISVVERVRLFGMLRAVGATTGQVRVLVLGEALALSAAALPLGLLLGIGTAALLAHSLVILKSAIGVLVVAPWVVVGSAAVGLAASLLSGLVPARFASRISPLAAIRGEGVLQIPAHEKKKAGRTIAKGSTGRLRLALSRRLRFTGWLACQNLLRSPGRSLVTIFSLGLGAALFVTISAYAANLDATNIAAHFVRGDYALVANDMNPESGYTQETAQAVSGLPGVESVIRTQLENGVYSLLPAELVDPEMKARVENMPHANDMQDFHGGNGVLAAPSQLFGYGTEELDRMKEYLLAGELDPLALSGEPAVLVVDPDGLWGLRPGDTLALKTARQEAGRTVFEQHNLWVAGILSDIPVSLGYGTVGPRLVVHSAVFADLTGSSLYRRFDLTMEEGAQAGQIENRLQTIAGQIPGGRVLSYRELLAGFEKEKRDLFLLVYGLVGVIALIGLANITNTLTTNLIVRTREFGNLRAVGMTGGQLRQIARLEGACYGLLSAAWGLLAGSGLAWLLSRLMSAQDEGLQPYFPWEAALFAGLGCVAVAILATIPPTRRIAGLRVVEALRFVA